MAAVGVIGTGLMGAACIERLKGAGLEALWLEGLVLVGLAILILTFARLRYRVRLG